MCTKNDCVLFRFAGLLALSVLFVLTADASADKTPENEQQLLSLLQSDAPAGEKAVACKNLAIYGSEAAVPELEKLLPNPQLSSWARIALEAIPSEACDEALRKTAESLEGRLLVGVINSIGVRRDAKAVDILSARLKDSDLEVASAAAVALGNIGDASATQSLRDALASATSELRSAVAEGCVLCAERLHNEGDSAAAAEVYDQVRLADVPTQRVIEATRGAILARAQEGIPLLLETFRSPDKKLFQLALGTVREFPGSEVDKAMAAELVDTSPDRAALLVQALADRPDTVDVSVVLKAAQSGDKQVRLSAIDALQRVGDGSCLSALLDMASDSDSDLAASAQQTLAVLPGKDIDRSIGARLSKADGEQYRNLLRLVGQRRINVVDDVQKALQSSDRDVRHAALVALGETVSLKQMSVLVSQVVRPSHAEDAAVAERALKAASVRMPDRETCATELTAALGRAPSSAKSVFLEILADVGGTKALATLASAAKSSDAQLQDAGSRLLGTWNSVAAAPVLLDLANTGPAEKYRVRALRGYLGLARKFAMPDAQRAEMCQNAFEATRRSSEHKLALDVLKLHPSVEGLRLAVNAMKTKPALKAEATAAVMAIAQKVGGKGVDVQTLLSGVGLDKLRLEIVKAEYGAGAKQKDVTGILRKQANGLPLITLASGYNSSFGGDPVPGVPKRLTVRYRMNGKSGEASFKENAPILLPMPQ